jgi:hypothetical protein
VIRALLATLAAVVDAALAPLDHDDPPAGVQPGCEMDAPPVGYDDDTADLTPLACEAILTVWQAEQITRWAGPAGVLLPTGPTPDAVIDMWRADLRGDP